MKLYTNHPVIFVASIVFVLLLGLSLFEFLYVKYNGSPVAVPTIPREIQSLGDYNQPRLRYAVLGDSTAVGQGADYADGIARGTANQLSKTYAVELQNFGVSGARCEDVLKSQLEAALAFQPNLVLLSVSANDVTHLTSPAAVGSCMRSILTTLKATQPTIAIVITGSPQMGSVPRFAQPLRAIAGARTAQLNRILLALAGEQKVTFAYLADQTGEQFAADHSLFASDNFHPNAAGYRVWTPVLSKAISTALSNKL